MKKLTIKVVWLLVGPIGSGKGTQAKLLAKKYGLVHISMGDLFRGATGKLREKLDYYMNARKLVPDKLVIKLLLQRISQEDCKNGIILDGFPRNIFQAEALAKILSVDRVIEISITDDEAVDRICFRIDCPSCGEIFNKKTNPPIQEGFCDKCGHNLRERSDKAESLTRKGLEIYRKETEPVLNFYPTEKRIKVDGQQEIPKLYQNLVDLIEPLFRF